MKIYRIAQVALKLGLSKQTLVRYEKKGLIPQSRRNHINHWREYTDEDVRRMRESLKRGFTLMEVVMVVAIIGIIAALTIPRFDFFYSVKLNGAVKKAVGDLRYVQQIAIARHANATVYFYAGNDTYAALEDAGGSPQYITDPFTRARMIVNLRTDPQYGGIDIINSTAVQFDWQGAAPAAAQVVLSYRGNRKTITVTQNTGKVSAQ